MMEHIDLAFDPVGIMEEILIIVLFVLVVLLAYRYRTKLMLFFTGDERFHINGLRQGVWYGLTCCGNCSGEWTRCPEWCPKCCRGVNLFQTCGQRAGLSTRTVEIKNIVAGDLPYEGYVADFYLGVECASNPTMYTSVAEATEPRIIQWSDSFTLRLRNNYMEQPVRIVIRAMHVVGSEDIAHCYIEASSIFNWASGEKEKDRVKRIELKPCSTNKQPVTTGWVLLQFEFPKDERNLDNFNGNGYMGTYVRTLTFEENDEGTLTLHQGKPYHKVEDFKNRYALQNSAGGAALEVPEEYLRTLRCYKQAYWWVWWILTIMVVFIMCGFCLYRGYDWTCWAQMVDLTRAHRLGRSFPINMHNLSEVETSCEQEIEGLPREEEGKKRCWPNETQVIEFCEDDGHFAVQPRPHVLQRGIRRHFGITTKTIPCWPEACGLHPTVRNWKWWIYLGVFPSLLLLWTCATNIVKACVRGEQVHIKHHLEAAKSIGVSETPRGGYYNSAPCGGLSCLS